MIFEAAIHSIASHLLQSVGRLAPYYRLLPYKIRRRKQRMRISFSALLCLHKEGQYVLIRSLHRPETFGPIGGVFKLADDDDVLVQRFEFQPQFHGDSRPDLVNDIRGFIPAMHLFNVVKWFEKHQGRESASECLTRELVEEFAEISCPTRPEPLATADLSKIRAVYEGPVPVPGEDYWQFRIVEVYKLRSSQKHEAVLKQLRSVGQASPHLVFASADEINTGRLRSGLGIIGRQAEYLLRGRSHRSESPPMVGAKP